MSLDDASQKRKERLALLSATKRKRDGQDGQDLRHDEAQEKEPAPSAMKFRNYDPVSNAPKLGYLHDPAAESETVELRAQELAKTVVDSTENQGIDVPLDTNQIQERKPNWDLKRDLEKRLEPLRARQEVIVARLVRERLLASKTGNGGTRATSDDPQLAQRIEQHERGMQSQTISAGL